MARVITGESGTKIFQLTDEAKVSLEKLSERNLNNPHVFGLDAKELFFQEDRIILTEGQEDVLFYPIVAEQLNQTIAGNFFGWGAGGASNIAHFCRVLKALGFAKVAGLLDGDKVAEAEALRVEFPLFHFACIPAKDIRTKPERKAAEETPGLLDAKMRLKPEFEEAMKQLLSELSIHMSPQQLDYAKGDVEPTNAEPHPQA